MKKLVLGFTLATFTLSAAATAGSLQDPIVENDVIATQAASSSAPGTGLVLFLAAVLFAVSVD